MQMLSPIIALKRSTVPLILGNKIPTIITNVIDLEISVR